MISLFALAKSNPDVQIDKHETHHSATARVELTMEPFRTIQMHRRAITLPLRNE